MKTSMRTIAAVCLLFVPALPTSAQQNVDLNRAGDRLGDLPAVSGHEASLSKALVEALQEFQPKTDNLGNVVLTVGTGAPHRLLATAIDEPGYVVSEITADGDFARATACRKLRRMARLTR